LEAAVAVVGAAVVAADGGADPLPGHARIHTLKSKKVRKKKQSESSFK
jgi:hypothetical protein